MGWGGGVDRGQARHRGQQRAGDEEGNKLAVHGWGVSVGEGGCGAASPASAGAAAALSPPPLSMYLPTIWMMSTAGVVNAISSPGFKDSRSPPGCRPMRSEEHTYELKSLMS